ncbi:MAG: hypothetical protein ACI9YT_001627 [Halobacteriales archaeon]|jgi:hypothetical protein
MLGTDNRKIHFIERAAVIKNSVRGTATGRMANWVTRIPGVVSENEGIYRLGIDD